MRRHAEIHTELLTQVRCGKPDARLSSLDRSENGAIEAPAPGSQASPGCAATARGELRCPDFAQRLLLDTTKAPLQSALRPASLCRCASDRVAGGRHGARVCDTHGYAPRRHESSPLLEERKLARVIKTPRTSHQEAVTRTTSDDARAMTTA